MDIRKRIKERGFTLEQVQKQLKNSHGGLGISQPSMSSLINGNPSFSRLQEIAQIIGVTVSELVRDDDTVGGGAGLVCPVCGAPLTLTAAGSMEHVGRSDG